MTVLPTALEGMKRAEDRVQRVAERLARSPSSPDVVDLSGEVVALLEARAVHAANAQVAAVGQEMERHLLDVLG